MQSEGQRNNLEIELDSVIVRPLLPGEKEHFKALLDKHHYLGYPAVIGQSIKYVALYKGYWLSLLIFSASALKCKARDEWIGWAPCFQWQRLHLIANNSRFLILPGCSKKNLSSRVLSLCARRISRDWQLLCGYPLLLLETFVDPSRFQGTCYRAAGWKELGLTRGYGKSNVRYVRHNHPKKILIKPLHRGARQILSGPLLCEIYQKEEVPQMRLNKKQRDSLFDHIAQLKEPRSFQGQRHRKNTLTAICLCAILCGARGYEAISDWAKNLSQAMRKRLRCRRDKGKYVVPSRSTIYRFLIAINHDELDKILGKWVQSLHPDDSGIAIDGKTMRGTGDDKSEQVHVLGAATHEKGISLTQKKWTQKQMRSLVSSPC